MNSISATKKHKPHTIHCPLCDGTGRAPDLQRYEILTVRLEKRAIRRERARALRRAGFTYRAIADLLKYSLRSAYLDCKDISL